MSRYAVIWMFANYLYIHKPDALYAAYIVTASVILLIVISYLILVAYDAPTRAFFGSLRKRSVSMRTAKLGSF